MVEIVIIVVPASEVEFDFAAPDDDPDVTLWRESAESELHPDLTGGGL